MGDGDKDRKPITLARLQEIAFGWMGMSRDDFWDSTLWEFQNRFAGWVELQEAERKHREFEYQVQTTHHRDLLYMIMSTVPRKKGEKLPPVTKWWPLPWDKKEKGVKAYTTDEVLKIAKEKMGLNLPAHWQERYEKGLKHDS